MPSASFKQPRTRIVLGVSLLAAIALAIIIPVTWFPKAPAAGTPATPPITANAAGDSEIDLGRTIAKAQCARCHLYYEPSSRTAAQWKTILPRMVKMSGLSADSAGKLDAYFAAGAK